MKDSKKYFKDINKLFPVHSYKEKKYLNDLKEQIGLFRKSGDI